jgi:hypothetical protein
VLYFRQLRRRPCRYAAAEAYHQHIVRVGLASGQSPIILKHNVSMKQGTSPMVEVNSPAAARSRVTITVPVLPRGKLYVGCAWRGEISRWKARLHKSDGTKTTKDQSRGKYAGGTYGYSSIQPHAAKQHNKSRYAIYRRYQHYTFLDAHCWNQHKYRQ